jgi:hypothetical protein
MFRHRRDRSRHVIPVTGYAMVSKGVSLPRRILPAEAPRFGSPDKAARPRTLPRCPGCAGRDARLPMPTREALGPATGDGPGDEEAPSVTGDGRWHGEPDMAGPRPARAASGTRRNDVGNDAVTLATFGSGGWAWASALSGPVPRIPECPSVGSSAEVAPASLTGARRIGRTAFGAVRGDTLAQVNGPPCDSRRIADPTRSTASDGKAGGGIQTGLARHSCPLLKPPPGTGRDRGSSRPHAGHIHRFLSERSAMGGQGHRPGAFTVPGTVSLHDAPGTWCRGSCRARGHVIEPSTACGPPQGAIPRVRNGWPDVRWSREAAGGP